MGPHLFTIRESGRTRGAVRHAATSGRVIRLDHGLYRSADVELEPVMQLAEFVKHRGAVASGPLAVVLAGADCWPAPPLRLDMTLPPNRRTTRGRGRRRVLADDEVVVVNGVECTSPVRTLIDMAPAVTDDQCEHLLEWVLRPQRDRHGHVVVPGASLAEVEEAVDAAGRRRDAGVRRLRRVIRRRPPGVAATESVLETIVVQVLRPLESEGWPHPQRQVEVYDGSGDFVARVDLLYPDHATVLEALGREHHADRLLADADRTLAVIAATGHRVVPVTWNHAVHTPAHLRNRVRDCLRGRSVPDPLVP